ncbi:MAG: GvpL/GvpF family gas vesicle protein [Candidatus Brocadiia bacterium]|jgi:hypothetical protein
MKYVLYGVLRPAEYAEPRLSALAEGASVCLIANGGLAAAVSIAPADAPPDPKRHAEVVQMLHEVCTVLPMRCGTGFRTEAEVHALLQDHVEEFRASLAALQGCAEMGLRVLCRVTAASAAEAGAGEPVSRTRAYLASRKAYYAGQDAKRRELLQAADRMQRPFDGLFLKCKMTPLSYGDTPILSFQFLVRRSDTERFRDAFRRLQQQTIEKLLLTGPWPPYSFAALDSAPLLRV